MTWWTLLESLRAYLLAYSGLAGVVVQTGADAELPEVSTVALLRGPAKPPAVHETVPGELTVWVEAWVYSTASDPGEGYRLLAALEAQAQEALAAWLASDPFPAAEIKALLPAWQPDGDMFRPSVGSRLDLVVKWRPRPI